MNNSVCLTGNRSVQPIHELMHRLKDAIESYINRGCDTFYNGGAVGFDTWASLIILRLKREKYPHVKLIICQPCQEQDKLWSDEQKATYKGILEKADEVVLVSDLPYAKFLMIKRNDYMLERSQYVLSIYDFSGGGGTFSTLNSAEKLENIREIMIIKP